MATVRNVLKYISEVNDIIPVWKTLYEVGAPNETISAV